jgi:branched-chain amino acid aminotransferase
MSDFVNINGHLKPFATAALAPDNRAFRYGYGLFETMLFQEGAILLRDLHWQRLFSGLQQLHFHIPALFTKDYLEQEVIRTVQKNKLEKLSRIRLQIFAGCGGLYDNLNPKPEFTIECFPLDAHILKLNEKGLVTGIAQGLQKSNDTLANLKTSNALIYAMAAQQAKANKWNDALLLNAHDSIIESTIANIFWVKEYIVHTPPLSQGCIAGVMRRYIIEQLQRQGIGIKEIPLCAEALGHADSIFLTNAIRRIKWVQNVDNHSFSDTLITDIYHSVFHKT